MAQTIVQGIRKIVESNGIEPAAVASIEIGVAEKVLSHHASREPRDVGTSQYSVPMCAAIALHQDPCDPNSFLLNPQENPSVRDWARRIELTYMPETASKGFEWASKVTISLKSGELISKMTKTFEGMSLAQASDLAFDKFRMLAAHLPETVRDGVQTKLMALERIDDVSLLFPE